MYNFEWGDEQIDSRDINSKYEDLKDDYDSLVECLDECQAALLNAKDDNDPNLQEYMQDVEDSQHALNEFNSSFDKDEMDTLAEVITEGEKANEWFRGVTLIHENHFTDYIKNIIEETYELPEELQSNQWPWNYLQMNYEDAAEEAKQDYYELEVSGHTYLYHV
jgi:predicted nuclease with TOPRIM domain